MSDGRRIRPTTHFILGTGVGFYVALSLTFFSQKSILPAEVEVGGALSKANSDLLVCTE